MRPAPHVWTRRALLASSLLACATALTSASAQTAQREAFGKYTIGLSSLGTAEAWLPWLESGREGWLGLEPVYESLVGSDVRTGDFLPQLSHRWEMEDQGKSWRFFLKKGVKFHDGTEFTAEDVVFSHEAMIADRSVSSSKPVLKALVEKIEVINPYEIVYRLRQQDVTFLGRVVQGNLGVVSKAYHEKVGEREAAAKPIGTGPYRMVEHKRQQFIVYEAIPNHHVETAGFKTVTLRRVTDQSARLWEKNLGLKVRRRPIDWATFAPNYGVSRKMPWVTWAHGFNPRAFPDPINGMDTWMMTESRYNSMAELPAIDALASKVRSETDRAKRVGLYREMGKILNEGYHAITVAAVPALYAYNPKRIASYPLPPGEAYLGGYHLAMPVR